MGITLSPGLWRCIVAEVEGFGEGRGGGGGVALGHQLLLRPLTASEEFLLRPMELPGQAHMRESPCLKKKKVREREKQNN